MKLLLISNSTNAGEEYLRYPMPEIGRFLQGIREIVFIPYAAVTFSYAEYERRVQARFSELGIRVRSVHRAADPAALVRQAEAICVGGGNTFALAKKMQEQGLMTAILRRIKAGVPYVGWSAGSNVCCPTICTTNDPTTSTPIPKATPARPENSASANTSRPTRAAGSPDCAKGACSATKRGVWSSSASVRCGCSNGASNPSKCSRATI